MSDALTQRAISDLTQFIDWCSFNGVKGYVGEVGWPVNPESTGADGEGPAKPTDTAEWNTLATAWYSAADAANLWVTHWGEGRVWGTWSTFAAWYSSTEAPGHGDYGAVIDSAQAGATVIAAHPTTVNYNRGCDVSGFEIYLVPEWPESAASFTYLYAQGVRMVKIAGSWSRLQQTLSGGPSGNALNAIELAAYQAVVAAAQTSGLLVILDIHEESGWYSGASETGTFYPLGSVTVPTSALIDFWQRMIAAFPVATYPNVLGFDIANEPQSNSGALTSSQWNTMSQAVVTAIRAIPDTRTIFIQGFNRAVPANWASTNGPMSWITDTANNFYYECHAYWWYDNPGQYTTYENALAAVQPPTTRYSRKSSGV